MTTALEGLKSARAAFNALNSESLNKIKIVVGNESCDLDSAASAIGYAQLLSSGNDSSTIILPLLDTLKKDLHLKTEVIYYLKRFNILEDALLFRDDQDQLIELGKKGQLEVVLVDHHINAVFIDWVVEIFDHRTISDPLNYSAAVKTRINQVGSCSSIILDEVLSRAKDNWIDTNPQIAEMLYGAILLDTDNLSEITKRSQPLDVSMVNAIESIVLNLEEKSRLDYFNHLLSVKCDVAHLTPIDLLRKDMKFTCGVAVCSLPILVQKFCDLHDAKSALQYLCTTTKMEEIILIGMQIQGDGGKTTTIFKDLGFYSNVEMNRLGVLMHGLQDSSFKLLRIDDLPCSKIGMTVFKMNNLLITRKHIMPVIVRVLTKPQGLSTVVNGKEVFQPS